MIDPCLALNNVAGGRPLASYMRKTREGAFAVLGGSIQTAYAYVGIVTSNYLSILQQLPTGDYLRLWSLAFLMVVFGFAVILGGFMIASTGRWKVVGGGILGILGSLLGGIVSLALLTTSVGLNTPTFNQPAQFSVASEILFIGCILTMFIGFPIGMYGSVGGVFREEDERSEEPEQNV